MKKLFLLLFIIPFMAIGQEKGICFEHNTTWAKVKEKAKAENKHIFVDAFTTWCGPCKLIAAIGLPPGLVVTVFGQNCGNLKFPRDEAGEVNDDVERLRPEADRFGLDYDVPAEPISVSFT